MGTFCESDVLPQIAHGIDDLVFTSKLPIRSGTLCCLTMAKLLLGTQQMLCRERQCDLSARCVNGIEAYAARLISEKLSPGVAVGSAIRTTGQTPKPRQPTEFYRVFTELSIL